MSLEATLIALASLAALAVFCGWRGARPWSVFDGPRLIPWRFLMLLAATGAIVMAAQALDAFGLRHPGH